MLTSRQFLAACLLGLPVVPVSAASFSCDAATKPFEQAICDSAELSLADERLAKSFATATGGLTKASVGLMRADQRGWLDFAQRACTDDAEPLLQGRYDERGASCLVSVFDTRSAALEQSRMIEGHRFFISARYDALPDPNEVDDPDSYWKVATHALVMPQLDADDPWAPAFNRFVAGIAGNQTSNMGMAGGEELAGGDGSSDSSVKLAIKEVAGDTRITMTLNSYWFGHGAAHGNWGISYQHYLVAQDRGLIAGDIFAGPDWASTLVDAAWAQLQEQHGEWLQVEAAADIADAVVDPRRWDLSNDYGLVIQFQPYEVSAYAYGAPTVTIPWSKLDDIKAETQDQVRYGW